MCSSDLFKVPTQARVHGWGAPGARRAPLGACCRKAEACASPVKQVLAVVQTSATGPKRWQGGGEYAGCNCAWCSLVPSSVRSAAAALQPLTQHVLAGRAGGRRCKFSNMGDRAKVMGGGEYVFDTGLAHASASASAPSGAAAVDIEAMRGHAANVGMQMVASSKSWLLCLVASSKSWLLCKGAPHQPTIVRESVM